MAAFAALATVALASPASAQLTLKLEHYATAPMTGSVDFPASSANSAYLARLNFMAEEPGGSHRFFVNDLNGPLYVLHKDRKQFTQYLNFNGRDMLPWMNGTPGMYDEFVYTSGFANGFITFQFDPDYQNNGKFYTVHMEQPSVLPGNNLPDTTGVPGLNTANYNPTATNPTSGGSTRQTVLVEWTDTNIANDVFEGNARELLRLDMQGQIHPMGDLIFNPTAGPGDPDWRVMYVSIGDGGAGERTVSGTDQALDLEIRRTPQRLDLLGGKILRIIPDLGEHVATSTVSDNGKYRIPNDNPFASRPEAEVRDEIFALGLRNPHRMSWDVDPENPANNHLIVNDIGLNTWEEVNIIHAGGNYGYSQREGNQRLSNTNGISAIPSPDTIPVQVTNSITDGTVTPLYPVAQYGHGNSGQTGFEGDSISSGYVYRGNRIPALKGKYVFGEITTGQIFYVDYDEMIAADDGNPATLATIHSIDLLWDDPATPAGEQLYTTITSAGGTHGPMFQIVEAGYEFRGGQDDRLPGNADVTGGSIGRADIRLQEDDAGELYILSKSDGMIRALVGPEADADFDQDGDVDGSDFLTSQRNLGSASGLAQGDATGDGFVDAEDLEYWSQQFGEVAPPAAAVPEPGTGVMMGLAALVVTLLRTKPRATGRAPAARGQG